MVAVVPKTKRKVGLNLRKKLLLEHTYVRW
jgi:hypothetical protein